MSKHDFMFPKKLENIPLEGLALGVFSITWLITITGSLINQAPPFLLIDDAYIYSKMAINLSNGNFLSFSSGEPNVNAASSFLFYLVSTLPFLLFKKLSFEQNLWLVYGFNFFLALCLFVASLKIFYSLPTIKQKIQENKINKWITLLFFLNPIFLLQYQNGLETGLTSFLLILQFSFFLKKKNKLFILISLISVINRPEQILVNIGYCIYFALRKEKRSLLLISGTLLIFSTLLLVNYIFTGSFLMTSSIRVGGLNSSIGVLVHNAIFIVQTLLFPGSSLLLDSFNSNKFIMPLLGSIVDIFSLNYYLSLSFVLLFTSSLYFIFKIRKMNYLIFWRSVQKTLGDLINFLKSVESVPFIIIASYLVVPIYKSGPGEMGRYVISIIPFICYVFIINCPAFLFYKKNLTVILALFSSLYLSSFSLILQDCFFYSKLMSKLIYPSAQWINKNTSKEDTILLDTAGVLSLATPGKVIDVYGLGTNRYKIRGDFEIVYSMIRDEKPNFYTTWKTKTKRAYLDSEHFNDALNQCQLTDKLISSINKRKDFVNSHVVTSINCEPLINKQD